MVGTNMKKKSEKIGLNLGPKTTEEMASIGIKSLVQIRRIGWEKAFRKLIAKYPERLNLNMASALIGAELGMDWRVIPRQHKEDAKALIKALKPKKQPLLKKANIDLSFVEYIISDQLASLDIHACRMFGAHGLYLDGKFVAIIHDGTLFLKTDKKSQKKFIEAGMEPFKPTQKQTLKNYYQVPGDVVEDADMLRGWFLEASRI